MRLRGGPRRRARRLQRTPAASRGVCGRPRPQPRGWGRRSRQADPRPLTRAPAGLSHPGLSALPASPALPPPGACSSCALCLKHFLQALNSSSSRASPGSLPWPCTAPLARVSAPASGFPGAPQPSGTASSPPHRGVRRAAMDRRRMNWNIWSSGDAGRGG